MECSQIQNDKTSKERQRPSKYSYFTENEQSFFQEIRNIIKYADMQRQRRETVKRYLMDVR